MYMAGFVPKPGERRIHATGVPVGVLAESSISFLSGGCSGDFCCLCVCCAAPLVNSINVFSGSTTEQGPKQSSPYHIINLVSLIFDYYQTYYNFVLVLLFNVIIIIMFISYMYFSDDSAYLSDDIIHVYAIYVFLR